MSESDPKRRKTDNNEEIMTNDEVEFIYKGQYKTQIPAGVSHVSTSQRVRKIKNEYFLCCKTLRQVSIGKSVKAIGRSAFEGCTNLAKVDLQEGLEDIFRSAFYRCASLVEVEIPGTVEEIGDNSFRGCTSLMRVLCNEGVVSIGNNSFKDCCSLIEITLAHGLERPGLGKFRRFGNGAFENCTSLSAMALPGSLEWIESAAFRGCTSLLGIAIAANCAPLHIEPGAFAGCTDLVNIWSQRVEFENCPFPMDRPAIIVDDISSDAAIKFVWYRYEHLPVHKLCYYSPTRWKDENCEEEVTVDELAEILGSGSALNPDHQEDIYGMTAFHVIATSAHPRADFLQCLLDHYPHEVLERRNRIGKTMIDYLVQHASPDAASLLKMVLEKIIMESISKWNLGDKWKMELGRRLAAIPNDHDTKVRRRRVNEFLQFVGYSLRLEHTSSVELALWKMKINAVSMDVFGSETMDRKSCRYKTGADTVVNNIAKYLWGGKSTASTALSMFSLISEESETAASQLM